MAGKFDEHRTPELRTVTVGGNREVRQVSPGLARYFRVALESLDYLELGDPAEYLLPITGTELPKSSLGSIWAPPRFKQEDDTGTEIVLDTLLADQASCVLVLADPGCGKSTLARFLTCFFINRYLRGEQEYFGLLAPLSTIRLSGLTYHQAAVACAAKYVGLEKDPDVLAALQDEFSRACVIFDGLDELPVAQRGRSDEALPLRREAAEMVRALRYVQAPEKGADRPHKLIVTSRSKDYSEARDAQVGVVPRYYISQFSPEQMATVVRRWHDAAASRVREMSKPSPRVIRSLEERCLAIQSALREHADVAAVCLTPVMLNAFQAVYSEHKDLPSSVSQLCWRAVRWFLIEKHTRTGQAAFVSANEAWLIDTLTSLGWYVQEKVVAGESKAFSDADLRMLARKSRIDSAFAGMDYGTQEDAITSVASFLRRGHGILAKVGDAEFDFVHNVFREVMAGRALRRIPVAQRHILVRQEQWLGPIRYWAGLRAADEDGLYEISAFVGELATDAKAGILSAALARAEMLAEVRVIVPAARVTHDLKRQILEVQQELQDLLKEHLRLSDRVRIGDLLSVLGDPRLEIPILERIQWVAAGQQRIGRIENHKTRIPKYQRCPASPEIAGVLTDFGVGRYLVTNHEFRAFVDASGYDDQRFWPDDTGWRWAQADRDVVASLIERARSVASTHLSSELAAQRLVPDEIPERCEQMIARTRPMYWLDPAHNRANQPVVGVNWWEAVAYCRWLDTSLKVSGVLPDDRVIRLPIEAEWETVARLCGSPTSCYPWVRGEPVDCAHVRGACAKTNDRPVFRACAVGLFTCVDASLPVYDLVGNVWEWTASKAAAYSQTSFEQVMNTSGIDDRIARGSSWLSSEEESTQHTFRSFDPPYNAYEDLGFRIAVCPRMPSGGYTK